jgi:hypothetical protein
MLRPDAPCRVRLKPREVKLAGLSTGELFAAGHACEPVGHGGAIVERWGAKQPRSTVDVLPTGDGGEAAHVTGLLARSPDDVTVYGGVGVSPPFGGPDETLGAADDGWKPMLDGDFGGLTPIVADDGARFVVGLLAPTRDLGRKLAAAYQGKHPTSTPSVYCHDPALPSGASSGPAGARMPPRKSP